MTEKMRKIRRKLCILFVNLVTACGLFLFWTVIILLLVSRQELISFLKQIYLEGTWKSIFVAVIPAVITAITVRIDAR